jgi:hypothetical protein
VIAIRGARVREYQGGKSISFSDDADVEIEPKS